MTDVPGVPGVPGGPERVELLLSVLDERYSDVLRAVRDSGAEVLEELPDLGTLSVAVPEDQVDALAAIDGVEAVERSRTFRLPPPESPLQ